MFQLLEKFIEEYFDQNPLSQLGLVLMKNKRAEKLTELSGNVRKHVKSLEGYVTLFSCIYLLAVFNFLYLIIKSKIIKSVVFKSNI